MKKLYSYSFAAVAALMLFSSCSKDEVKNPVQDPEEVAPVAEKVTISVSMPDEGLTKVTLTQDAENKKVIKLAWEYTDELDINGNTFKVKTGSISGDGKSAEFEGTAPAPDGAGKYTISYSKLAGGYAEQTQSEDGDARHLGYAVSISGADSYTGITFSEAGASAVGGTFSQSSVLRLRAKLPDVVASAVQKVIFKASEAVFAGSKELAVNLNTHGTAGDDKTLDVYATLPAGDAINATAMDLLIQFQISANAYDKYTVYRQIPASTNFGTPQYIGIDCSNIDKYAGKDDEGTAEKPYLIGDRHQLAGISSLLSTEATKYFRLIDDISATTAGTIDCKEKGSIDFDGDNKTITGMTSPFFSVLVGKVYDLTLSDVTVPSGNYYGALVRTINGGDCEITKVSASGSAAGTGNQRGGLIGRIESSTNSCVLINCSANVTVSGGQNIGGLVGYVNFDATFKDCFATGNVSGSQYYIGGLIGQLKDGTLNNCHASSGTVASSADVNFSHIGGLVGNMVGGSLNKCFSTDDVEGKGYNVGGLVGTFAGGSIKKCYSGGKVKSTHTAVTRNNRVGGFIGAITAASLEVSDSYSTGTVTGNANCGGFIGYCDKATTITNCYTTSSVDATDPGALIGNLNGGTISGSGFIAWWASGNMVGTGDAHSLTTSYLGNTDSIYSQAVALGGWDFINVWTTDATPTLR